MPWVRVDDHFDEHPKFAQAGPLGIALWIAGLAYCNRMLTDGFIPWTVARTLVSWEFLGPEIDEERGRKIYRVSISSGMVGDNVDSEFVINLLVDSGLWEDLGDGYQIHDYASYQPTKETVERERAKKAAAGKAGGIASAVARATADAQAELQHTSSTKLANGGDSGMSASDDLQPDPLLQREYPEKTADATASAQAPAIAKSKPVPKPNRIETTNVVSIAPNGAEKKSKRKMRSPTEQDVFWEAFVESIGIRPTTTGECTKWGTGIKQLRDADIPVSLREVPDLVRAYRKRFPKMPCNPLAIANNLAELQVLPGNDDNPYETIAEFEARQGHEHNGPVDRGGMH